MIVFFAIVGFIGLFLIVVDLAAMSSDPTPSQYNYAASSWGILLAIIGIIGAGCVFLFG